MRQCLVKPKSIVSMELLQCLVMDTDCYGTVTVHAHWLCTVVFGVGLTHSCTCDHQYVGTALHKVHHILNRVDIRQFGS